VALETYEIIRQEGAVIEEALDEELDEDDTGDVAAGSYINEKVPGLVHEISEKVDLLRVGGRNELGQNDDAQARISPGSKAIPIQPGPGVDGRPREGYDIIPGRSVDSSRTMN
jgi:hypothetical protein